MEIRKCKCYHQLSFYRSQVQSSPQIHATQDFHLEGLQLGGLFSGDGRGCLGPLLLHLLSSQYNLPTHQGQPIGTRLPDPDKNFRVFKQILHQLIFQTFPQTFFVCIWRKQLSLFFTVSLTHICHIIYSVTSKL